MSTLSTIAIIVADAGVIVGAVLAVWRGFNKYKKEMTDKFEKIMDGMKCQHRSAMLSIYYKNKDSRKIRQYEFEDFLMHYSSYKALNGNSFIDKIYGEVTEFEIIT